MVCALASDIGAPVPHLKPPPPPPPEGRFCRDPAWGLPSSSSVKMMEDESELALCRLLRLVLSTGRLAASAHSSSSSLSAPPANAEGGAGGELPPVRDVAGEAPRFEASFGGSLAASSFFDVQRGVV